MRFMGRWFYLGRFIFSIGNILLITTNKKREGALLWKMKNEHFNILHCRQEVGLNISDVKF